MPLLKLISRLGQGAMTGLGMNRSTSNWTMIKVGYNKNITNKAANTLRFNCLHVRNGSRGNGIGMGRESRLGKIK